MLRKDREIVEKGKIESIIGKALCCRIGLVDGDEPYVVPVNFGYERNALYFHGALKGRKIDIIRKNNKVCFEIDTDLEIKKADKPCDWGMKYRSVIGAGSARILENDGEKTHGLSLIMKQYTVSDFTFPKPSLDSVLVIKIDISSISGKQSGY